MTGFDPIPDVTDRIWDVADYVVPAEVRLLLLFEDMTIYFASQNQFKIFTQ